MKQKPVLVWGEHRSTERLPIDIKKRLELDPEIKERIIFTEYEPWEKSDYLSLARRWDDQYREAYGIPDPILSFGRFISEIADKETKEITEKYELRLYKKNRPLVFNLHSFFKDCQSPYILFCLNEELLLNDGLRETILRTGAKNNVNVEIGQLFLYQHEKHSPISLIEFSLHRSIASYSDRETEYLAKDIGWENILYSDNVHHPFYESAIKSYSRYMKDFLLSITEI